MKNVLWVGALALTVVGCAAGPDTHGEGGANAHDRSQGGAEGEKLETGAMTLSPDGRWGIMQRNTVTVLVDFEKKTAEELPFVVERAAWSRRGDVAYVVLADRRGVGALRLESASLAWKVVPAFKTTAGATLARLTQDEDALVVGDLDRVFVIATKDGDVRGTVPVPSGPTDIEPLAGGRALVVGATQWRDHAPKTEVVLLDVASLRDARVDVPNCAAPIVATQGGARALLSPTYCEEARPAGEAASWTNPDPVSVIDLGPDLSLRFVKNLPGFGPVAVTPDGARAVAYLDTKRMDRAMFDDPAQIPGPGAPRYHLMVIDARTLRFTLDGVGDVLPRFAMDERGAGLLVDGTAELARGEATATVKVSPGGVTAEIGGAFGGGRGLFGYFDLGARRYSPFTGPPASLDRFVQRDDGQVFTLRTRADGMGGDLFRVDVGARATEDLGKSLRDVGLLPDGSLVLRIRLEAAVEAGAKYAQEEYCVSRDGRACSASIRFRGKTPLPSCEHDCY